MVSDWGGGIKLVLWYFKIIVFIDDISLIYKIKGNIDINVFFSIWFGKILEF